MIKQHDCLAGVVLNPATPVDTLTDVFDLVDYILIMSVNPGFGGQKFIRHSLKKIATLATIRNQQGFNFRIEVDGGVSLETVGDVVRAGAEILVAGSAVFGSGDPKQHAQKLIRAATEATMLRA
jgi:ribulose-phosphate 3-epimerase